MKRKTRDFLDFGNDIENPTHFMAAMRYGRPIDGLSVYRSKVDRSVPRPTSKARPSLPGISKLYDFRINEDGTVRAWRFYGIGGGKTIDTSKWHGAQNTANLIVYDVSF